MVHVSHIFISWQAYWPNTIYELMKVEIISKNDFAYKAMKDQMIAINLRNQYDGLDVPMQCHLFQRTSGIAHADRYVQ